MGEYKKENGTTRVGDLLRSIGDAGSPILELVGGLTGQDWLEKVGELIGGSSELKLEQKKLAMELLKLDMEDMANARNANAEIQSSANSSWLAKNTGYLIDISMIALLIAVIIALFKVAIPESNDEVAYMVLGYVLSYVGSIISFHRGSSEGSKSKTVELIKSLKKK